MSASTELQRAVALTGSIQELRQELVRKDVYQSDQRNVDARIISIEDKIRGAGGRGCGGQGPSKARGAPHRGPAPAPRLVHRPRRPC